MPRAQPLDTPFMQNWPAEHPKQVLETKTTPGTVHAIQTVPPGAVVYVPTTQVAQLRSLLLAAE